MWALKNQEKVKTSSTKIRTSRIKGRTHLEF